MIARPFAPEVAYWFGPAPAHARLGQHLPLGAGEEPVWILRDDLTGPAGLPGGGK